MDYNEIGPEGADNFLNHMGANANLEELGWVKKEKTECWLRSRGRTKTRS